MGGGMGGGNFGNTYGNHTDDGSTTLDAISNLLTVASLIPGIDTFADILAIPVDLARKDYLSAALDLAGAIPFIGEIADTAKTVDKTTDVVKAVNKVTDASKAVKYTSPHSLAKTHELTLSRKQFSNLVDNIKKNGITEPIKYVEYKGTKYVVDGHHRLEAAKQLKLKDIPIEKVELPYKGYKTVNDLLWPD